MLEYAFYQSIKSPVQNCSIQNSPPESLTRSFYVYVLPTYFRDLKGENGPGYVCVFLFNIKVLK